MFNALSLVFSFKTFSKTFIRILVGSSTNPWKKTNGSVIYLDPSQRYPAMPLISYYVLLKNLPENRGCFYVFKYIRL